MREFFCRIEYDFQKSRVTGPWDHKVLVSAKKGKKKFHACVPLISAIHQHYMYAWPDQKFFL